MANNKIKIERRRFIVMTSDKKQILVGMSKNLSFEDVENIKSDSIRTFSSDNKAKNILLKSCMGALVKESDFEVGGKYIIVPIMETLQEI